MDMNDERMMILKMLKELDGDVKLTSFYFSFELENEDQDRFRSTVGDLLELYRASNRGKIETEAVNPLQDHDRRKEVFERLAKLDKFKEAAKAAETDDDERRFDENLKRLASKKKEDAE